MFVTATAGDPRSAARIANQVAQTFVDEQAAVEKRQLEAARANLLEEQNRLRGTTGADSQLQAIQQRLSELGVALAAAGTELGIAERATPPEERAAPKPVRNGVLAAFLGLFIGVLVALGRDQLVPRVSSQRELSRLIDLPLLASIPYVNRRFGLRPKVLSGIEYETYQSLAASVRFALPPTDEPRLVLVTSALHAEGKSTVSRAARRRARPGRAAHAARVRRPALADAARAGRGPARARPHRRAAAARAPRRPGRRPPPARELDRPGHRPVAPRHAALPAVAATRSPTPRACSPARRWTRWPPR